MSLSPRHLLLRQLGQLLPRPFDPSGPLLRRLQGPLLAPTLRLPGIFVQLALQLRDPFGHRLLDALQPLALAHRAAARAGPHFGPVDRHLLQSDQFFGDQPGHALRQQAVQLRRILPAKRRQQIVIDRCTAAQPAIGRMLLAQAIDRPRRADPLQRRIKPHRQHHLRIRRRAPGNRVARLDPIVKFAQIQTFDKGPNQPRSVVVRQLAIQVDHLPTQLRAVRTNDPSTLAHRNPPNPTNRIISQQCNNS